MQCNYGYVIRVRWLLSSELHQLKSKEAANGSHATCRDKQCKQSWHCCHLMDTKKLQTAPIEWAACKTL